MQIHQLPFLKNDNRFDNFRIIDYRLHNCFLLSVNKQRQKKNLLCDDLAKIMIVSKINSLRKSKGEKKKCLIQQFLRKGKYIRNNKKYV